MTKNNNHSIDFAKKTITVTKEFTQRASTYGTEEYTILRNLLHDNPDFKVVVNAIAKNANKQKYGELNYPTMEKFIKFIHKDDESLYLKRMADYWNIREFAAIHKKGGYPLVKKWFLGLYKDSYLKYVNGMLDKEKADQDISSATQDAVEDTSSAAQDAAQSLTLVEDAAQSSTSVEDIA